jgi:hypothetical protein
MNTRPDTFNTPTSSITYALRAVVQRNETSALGKVTMYLLSTPEGTFKYTRRDLAAGITFHTGLDTDCAKLIANRYFNSLLPAFVAS